MYRWLAASLGDAEARAALASVGHSCDLAYAPHAKSLEAHAADHEDEEGEDEDSKETDD